MRTTESTSIRQARHRVVATLVPPLLFLLLSALFLWQPAMTGRVLLPTDLIYRYDYVWRGLVQHPG